MEVSDVEIANGLHDKLNGNGAAEPAQANTFAVYNPATGEKLTDLPIYSPAEVAEAAQRSRQAQKEWEALGFKGRAEILKRWRSKIVANKNRLIELLVAENGKPRQEAIYELLYLSDILGYYSSNAAKFLKDQKVSLHLLKNKRALVTYHPFGVVGVISPWNYPLILAYGDTIAALAAGNGVVLKPSEITPLAALKVAELAAEAGFPAGLLQVVTGLGETGAALVDNVDLVAFTGSVNTGKKVMEQASRRLTPVLLELGGKDPMIVLKDADLERAVNGAMNGAFFNNGQTCISVERLYVEEPIYDQFVARLVEKVKNLRLGSDPSGEHKVDIGPMTFPRQLEIVERQIEDARTRGAKILTGGKSRKDLPGLFYEPTVLSEVTDEMLVMREETFGPVLPVIKVKDAADAIRKANLSNFGLSSSIWTRDKAKGEALARQVEAGSTCVNEVLINYVALEVPFGGIKDSGIGFRHGGAEGLKKFCRPHSIVIDRFGLKREVLWMPYSKSFSGTLHTVMNLLYKRHK
jgi:acyl-CoA reductase-like NAD-dependent aldehyde dehydrogenase